MLKLDPATHEYTFGGAPVPGVTKVLSSLTDYSRIGPVTLEHARQEGEAIHLMVQLECANDLALGTLPEWIKGYLAGWMKFRADSGFSLIASEKMVYHADLRYAGTLDLVCRLPNFSAMKGPVLIDIKRSFYAGPVIGLQLEAYRDAFNSERGRSKKAFIPENNRYALRLAKDGTYALKHYTGRDDHAIFLSMLNIFRWRQQHGK